MRVEANLPGTSAVAALFLLQAHNKQMFDLENEGQSDGARYPPLVPFDYKKNHNL